MARKVKCAISGEYGMSDTFVKIKGKYYKSQELYDKVQHQKDLHKQIVDFICFNILDYQKGQTFPTILTKKLSELKFYDNEVILKAFQDYENDIAYWLNKKHIDNDYGKIAYMFAIIKAHINDVYEEWKKEKRASKENPNIQHTDININTIQTKHKGKDIRTWLEDDEL